MTVVARGCQPYGCAIVDYQGPVYLRLGRAHRLSRIRSLSSIEPLSFAKGTTWHRLWALSLPCLVAADNLARKASTAGYWAWLRQA